MKKSNKQKTLLKYDIKNGEELTEIYLKKDVL